MPENELIDAPANLPTSETPPAPSNEPPADKPDAGTPDPVGDGTISDKPAAPAAPDADKGALQQLRETLAGGDEKVLKELERYKTTEALAKAMREARVAARNAGKPVRLSDKATEDEVKAYREAVGIPDDPEAYPVQFREDYKATEVDGAILGDFRARMHEMNVDPAAASAALEWYQDFAQQQQQELDGNLAKVAKETQAALRTEWGGEYDGNIAAVAELMTTHLGPEGFDEMMGLRMMDGSRLQDHPGFVKMMAGIGTDYYGSNAIFNGDIETTAKTVQEQIDETLKMRIEDPEKYKSDPVQEKLTKLYAQKAKIDGRKK